MSEKIEKLLEELIAELKKQPTVRDLAANAALSGFTVSRNAKFRHFADEAYSAADAMMERRAPFWKPSVPPKKKKPQPVKKKGKK